MYSEMYGVGEYDMHDMIFKVEALYGKFPFSDNAVARNPAYF